ncbi:MAG: T9SS type A sorting domain-containing protein [Melioribacteraceae bacterium]|nr:T9SS type A sorting domain-containing protein [Melioribacteraceae bacterium]
MHKIVTILILFFCTITYSQINPIYFNLDVPDYIPVNSQFEISAVTSFNGLNADKCEVSLFLENKLSVNTAYLVTRTNKVELKTLLVDNNEHLDKSYLSVINLQDTLFNSNSPVQIRYKIQPSGALTSEIGIKIVFFLNNEPVYIISSFDQFDTDQLIDPIYAIFYKPSLIEGNNLLLNNREALEYKLPSEIKNNKLAIEFWTKINGVGSEVIKFLDGVGNSKLSLELNRFEVLSLDTENLYDIFDDFFIAPNSWNHIVVEYLKYERIVNIYCNERKVFTLQSELLEYSSKLQIGGGGEIYLENLRIWDFGNNINLIHSNKNYSYFSADSSQLISSFDFNKKEGFKIIDIESGVESNSYKLELSEVPIYSRLPVLDAKLNNNYYLFEWSNKELADISEFILEKSGDGVGFNKIYSVEGSGEKDKIYSFADVKTFNSELIYYRIKQINSDSSIVYSNQIKIGQGEKEVFHLEQNYPNPFNPVTTINVEMFETNEVEITVFNLVGNKIEKLHKGVLAEGIHEFNFDGANLTSGIYFIEVKTNKVTRAKKMILAK